MAPPVGVAAHVRGAAEARDPVLRDRRAVALEVNLQRRADEQVGRIQPGDLAIHPVRPHRAVPPVEVDVRSGAHVLVHADFRAEAVDLLDPAGLDGGDQRRVRVERPMGADLALEAKLVGVGRQQQLDGGGIEADAVVEPLDAVLGIDALDGHHRRQDHGFRDLRRVAGEQRLDVERLGGLHDEVDMVARHVHPGQRVHDLVDLCHPDALLEGRRLDDHRGVLGVRPHVQVALAVGGAGQGEGDVRGQVHEVAGEQLDVGVDRAKLHLAGIERAGHRAALGA